MSLAERSFYGVLVTALGQAFVVCPKVRVADILFVARPNENLKYQNMIDHHWHCPLYPGGTACLSALAIVLRECPSSWAIARELIPSMKCLRRISS